MPENYSCKTCRLSFSVGWYHYHNFENGFGASTLLVCRGCGICYRLEHAILGHKPDKLWTQPESATAPDDGEGLLLGFKDWVEVRLDANPRPEREERPQMPAWFEAITDKLDLTSIPCHYCRSTGSLTSEWSEQDKKCPRCFEMTLEQESFWIT